MTTLLKEVFERASQLPVIEQDLLARELMAELESESNWDQTLNRSQDALTKLGRKALDEYMRLLPSL